MPASLRFVLSLLGGAALLAIVCGAVLTRQSHEEARINAEQLTGGNSAAGKADIQRLGCGACHEIKGIRGARGAVGPALTGIGDRAELAGRLANTPDNMIRWIRTPQAIDPKSGMPDMGLSDRQARDVAAYIYTLRTSRPDK
jgi:cytochrome c2